MVGLRHVVIPGLWVASLLAIAAPAAAQTTEPSLTSNRPGIGDSEALVPRGAFQLEAGVQWQEAPPESERRWTQTWGEITARVGVSRRVEVFAGWDGLSLDRTQVSGESRFVAGGNDVGLGAKLAVLDEAHQGLTLTLSPSVSLPIGSDEFSSGSTDESIGVLWARSLPRDWSVGGNAQLLRTTDDAGRYWDRIVTFAVSRQLTSSISAMVETAVRLLAHHPNSWTIDGGLAWVARPNLQWDISAGHTFHDQDDDWFVTGGITIRRRGQ